MVARKRSTPVFVPEPDYSTPDDPQPEVPAAGGRPDFDAADAFLDPTCPCCGELLAWHEQPCPPPGGPAPAATTPPAPNAASVPASSADAAPEPAVPGLAPAPFAYAVGQPVQPAPGVPARPVIWRGQVKARHPRTGLVHRLNVYRLNDGFWDCYYESDLSAA